MTRVILKILPLVLFANPVFATKSNGRIALGGYFAKETFKDTASGSENNDFLTASSRFFLKLSEIGGSAWETTSDLRDKHDFFDKLDRERLELNERNTFQVREMNAKYGNDKSNFLASIGRFSAPDAGAVYVDGAGLGLKIKNQFTSFVFGGLNPKRPDQSYVQWNSNSNIYGGYLLYSPTSENWSKSFYASLAYVTEIVESHTDRTYLYNSLIYQWNNKSRIINTTYLDFVPRTNVQTASFMWQQGIGNTFTSQLQYLAIDVIEYTRRQDVLERLDPSPYKEVSLNLENEFHKNFTFEVSYKNGVRDGDGFTKNEYLMGAKFPQAFSKNFDAHIQAGYADNFTSKDILGRFNLGFFTNKWEFYLDEDYSAVDNENGADLNNLTSELSAGLFISKSLFIAGSVQYAFNEQVNILSGFLKLNYRFGNQGIPPIRDGAPPRGRL